MARKKPTKKLLFILRNNYTIALIIGIVLFVGIGIANRIFLSPPTYIYVKVKMGQGLWWANTTRPSSWFTNSIKKGDKSTDFLGKNQAEILSVRKYPYWGNSLYDIYLNIRLKVNYNKKNGEYSFSRSTISIGSPIEIQFPNTNITGTVVDMSKKPFSDKYVEKTILLVNQDGYKKDFPYRYDEVKINDTYFDGEDIVFKVLDKSLQKNIWTIVNNMNAELYERDILSTQTILVTAKVKVKEKNKEFYYGEDYKLTAGASIPFATSNFSFEGYIIRKID